MLVEELITFSVLCYLADVDSGRIARQTSTKETIASCTAQLLTRAARTSEIVGKRRDRVGDGRDGMSGREPSGCGVFAKVVAKVGQREVDVTVTC